MSLPKGSTVTLYAREPELKEPDPEPFMYMLDKWMDIEAALESGAGAVTAAFPEVQGDTYSEWIVYLGKLTEHQ